MVHRYVRIRNCSRKVQNISVTGEKQNTAHCQEVISRNITLKETTFLSLENFFFFFVVTEEHVFLKPWY